jgi:hypothetical protein
MHRIACTMRISQAHYVWKTCIRYVSSPCTHLRSMHMTYTHVHNGICIKPMNEHCTEYANDMYIKHMNEHIHTDTQWPICEAHALMKKKHAWLQWHKNSSISGCFDACIFLWMTWKIQASRDVKVDACIFLWMTWKIQASWDVSMPAYSCEWHGNWSTSGC